MSPYTLAESRATLEQQRIACAIAALVCLVTLALMPIASRELPEMPGFVAVYQSVLIVAFGLSAAVLVGRFAQEGSVPLLILGAGAIFTLIIVSLQLLSFPRVFAVGPLFGVGPDTTIWLWTFWHLGPPACALVYALNSRQPARRVEDNQRITWLTGAAFCSVALGGIAALLSSSYVHLLPKSVAGNDYTLLVTTGIGPAVQVLTFVALWALWKRTRGAMTLLELWLCVSLVLLIADNFVTFAGAARNTVGWLVGRLEALLSAWAVTAVYLHELSALRKKADASEAQLRQVQRMEALGKLTSGVAHDFNNLLMVMMGSLEAIRRNPNDNARVLKMVDHGLEAAERGKRLTSQLLVFARKQVLRAEIVNINQLIGRFEGLLRRAAGENVELRFSLDAQACPVQVDEAQLEACLLNMIVNARDAMPTGGRISIETRNFTAKDNNTALEPSRGYLLISISDTGHGMNEEVQSHAFEPFYSTKEVGKGTGLGLSQVYGFVKSAGGDVELESQVGRGTTIRLYLPAYAGVFNDEAKSTPIVPAAPAITVGKRILVVEDDAAVARTSQSSLEALGYNVVVVTTAADAIALLSRGSEHFDTLFSDVVMPGGMNGVQLAMEAKKLRPYLQILLTSGYPQPGVNMPLDVPILAKPYRQDELAIFLQNPASVH